MDNRVFRFIRTSLLAIATFMTCVGAVPAGSADTSILKQIILEYNRTAYLDSLADGSYKGTAGILNIDPDVARSLGIKALITREYLDAKGSEAEAERLFNQAVSALSVEEEDAKGELVGRAGESAVASREARAAARRLFAAYRSQVTPETDERLNEEACSRVMDSLLGESMKRASFELRDGLGMYYNRCQGLAESAPPLTSENVKFVNYVFSEFQQKGSEADRSAFDLGRQDPARGTVPGAVWKAAIRGEATQLVGIMESVLERTRSGTYPVDPLLFFALMRRESNFDPRAVSYVGAAGLTQIMPQTGRDLGMKQIFQPFYFEEAQSLLKRERDLRQKAISLLLAITPENRVTQVRLARDTMQDSLNCGRNRAHLFGRYRRELLENGQDDRLDPQKAISYGYRYLSDLMRIQKGDISLALASYNAGAHRVKQFNGLPPYAETVTFRNTVLKHYREYLERLK